ncbi:MAG TPA: zinc-binding dehydrogenase [Gemmatimonadales bacterium]|nr:zinc-binding dehydrogenase [Gemmatimonadales bacterium]
MRAIRFHYRPLRYLVTRAISGRWPGVAWSPLGCLQLDEVEPPVLPGRDWVRIETALSGICGSDLAAVTAHDSFTLEPFGAYPFTFGHENVGRVVETGPDVRGWSVGDRVVVSPMLACRQRGLDACAACARGEYGLCRNTGEGEPGRGPMIGYSPGTGGGWSRSFVAHESQLFEAGGLADEVAVLTDPLASALRPVLLQPPADDDSVLVIGAGSIGLLTVAALRATGWAGPLAVSCRHAAQAERAQRAGASVVLRSHAALYEWAGSSPGAKAYRPTLAAPFVEGGPSLVYDTVGSERTVRESLSLTREGGRVVLVGAAARVAVDLTRLWYRHLTVAGIFAYGPVPWRGERQDIYDVSLELLRDARFAALDLLTHTFSLEDWRVALSAALDKGGTGSIKVAFRPGD